MLLKKHLKPLYFLRELCDSSNICVCDLVALCWFKGFTAGVDGLQLVGSMWEYLFHSPTMPSYKHTLYACSHTVHGRREPAPSVTRKIWRVFLLLLNVDILWNLTISQQDKGMQTLCKHLIHTLTHTSAVYAEGKIQLFVCLGGFSTTVTTFTHSERKSFCYLKHTMLTIKGLFMRPCICMSCQIKSGAPSWREQTSSRDKSLVCRMT